MLWFAISVISGLVWLVVFAPMAARVVGVPLPIGLRTRRHAIGAMTFKEFVWTQGVLSWGMAVFVSNVFDQLSSSQWSNIMTARTITAVASSFVFYALLGGLSVGLMMWYGSGRTEPHEKHL
jgi:hypothetical protein